MTDATPWVIALLRQGQPVTFVVRGASMWPSLRDGARVTVQPCPVACLRPGDLVAFERRGALVVHRVRAVTAEGVRSAGDALPRGDGLVPQSAVLGRAQRVSQPPWRWRDLRPTHLLRAWRWARNGLPG
ncbi:MAG: S26 family signal peptidase [Deltaproteobacteria bacterium]|nr:S26 family signal peptidase [Deltaproteobacteria bacterium]